MGGDDAKKQGRNEEATELERSFSKVLDRHGYGLQYAILKVAERLWSEGKSRWLFEACEFPVEVQGKGTRIDFLLKYQGGSAFMVAECKRADPRFSRWCFVRAPFVRRNQERDMLVLEGVETKASDRLAYSLAVRQLQPREASHIGLALKRHQTAGDSPKTRSDSIEDAVSQVCRGVNGMVNLLIEEHKLGGEDVLFIPVVFTTADLWVSNTDLSAASLEDGKVPTDESKLTKTAFVFYQYHLSPGIKHTMSPAYQPQRLSDFLSDRYIRTVVIVNALAAEAFLQRPVYDVGNSDVIL